MTRAMQLAKDGLPEAGIPYFREISDPAGPDFQFIVRLLTNTFPPAERRPIPDLANLIRKRANFHCRLILADGKPVGLLNWWHFEKFNFLEHFALAPCARNKGLGAAALQNILLCGSLLLEVERPDSVLKRRRIAFYERNGLRLWDDAPYIQPPYTPGQEPVPMSLMASPELQRSQAEECISILYKNVYGKADLS